MQNIFENVLFINHRINNIENLENIPSQNGIELDIRYHDNDLILQHDAFNHYLQKNTKFEDLLKVYKNEGLLIVNLKTEGVEGKCIELLNKYNIKNWAFLDMSMPYFVKYANKAKANEIKGFSKNNLMVRFSEFEPIEYALSFTEKVKFIWVDCFTYLPLNKENFQTIKENGFEIVLVSPELQGHSLERIQEFKKILLDEGIAPYGICTKRPDLWQNN